MANKSHQSQARGDFVEGKRMSMRMGSSSIPSTVTWEGGVLSNAVA